jgi:hypothetical protein
MLGVARSQGWRHRLAQPRDRLGRRRFDEYVWAPHLILGLLEIDSALVTQTRPSYDHAGARVA